MHHAIILDSATMRGLQRGTITQVSRLASSPLAACRPGDTLLVREACVLARLTDAGHEESARPRDATLAVFADGVRRHRDGRTGGGPPPTNPRLIWTPALRMPRWAARAWLSVAATRVGAVQAIDPVGLQAAGVRPLGAGFFWRAQDGRWSRDPRRTYAAMWDRAHATPGERWADDPQVVTLTVRLIAVGDDSPPAMA